MRQRQMHWLERSAGCYREAVICSGFNGPPAVVAGVTKDFHFASMQTAIQPITFGHVNSINIFRLLSFKLKPGNIGASAEALQKNGLHFYRARLSNILSWMILLPNCIHQNYS